MRVVFLACDMSKGPYLCLYQNIIKIFQTIKKLCCSQEFGIEIFSLEITERKPKQKLSFLHTIFLLDLWMFLSIIIKLSQTVWELWPAQDFGFCRYKYQMKKLSHAGNTPTGPYLFLYQILSKYFKPLRSYSVHKNLA